MLDQHPNLIAFRGFMVAVCLAQLVGCGGGAGTVGDKSGSSAVGTTSVASVTDLAAPTNVTATAGNAQASLTWSVSTGATSYDVQRSTISGGPYTQLAATDSPSFTDTTVSNGTTYYYVVMAVDSSSESGDSAEVSVTPDPTITAPLVPTGLTATAADAQVNLAWTASAGASSYDVKRATTSGGPYTQIAVSMATSYVNTALTDGTTYYYVVSAVDSAGESANSAQVSAVPTVQTAIPSPPSNLSATPGNAQVTLRWSPSAGATGYTVNRATASGGPYTQIGAPTASPFVDSSAINGTRYYYAVAAVDSAGASANSAQVTATPAAPVSVAAAPTGLTATAGNAQVALTWSASTGATSYHVKRATTSGGTYTQVGAPTAASYTDSSLTNGTTYYYVVSAIDSAGEGANSSQVSAVPVASSVVAAVPTGVSATAGNAQVALAWSTSSGATSYHVKRAITSGGPYTQVGTPTSASYTDAAVTNGTTYYYVISALDSAGESANSSQVSAAPAAPTSAPTTFGTWINVTPSNVNLSSAMDCGNYGTETAQADTANPGTLYVQFNCQGIWKSTDYGQTWTGPIASTGTNAAITNDCAGGITVNPSNTAGGVPTIYMSCIRGGAVTGNSTSGSAIGFWRSTDGGLNWSNINLTPLSSGRQDVYQAVIDPYDRTHLLMNGHEQDALLQSTDGGSTWTSVNLASGMMENGGTGFLFFINTGVSSTTRTTWLWMAQQSGGTYGTWRTTNGGATWTQVDTNEHPHGSSQIYQPDNNGVVYMTGAYSAGGWGVLRSANYGQTWTHVGQTNNETIVWGTTKNVYSMYGYPIGIGGTNNPGFELASQPGSGNWAAPGTPSGLSQGAAQVAVVNNGTNNIFVLAAWNSGLWRYVEP